MRFYFGEDPGYVQLGAFAWYFQNTGTAPLFADASPRPVGSKPANPWGLYDMHGNMAEWCISTYVPYPGGSVTDWNVPVTGVRPVAVFRGGSWGSDPWSCRSAYRGFAYTTFAHQAIGFRVVLAPVTPSQECH